MEGQLRRSGYSRGSSSRNSDAWIAAGKYLQGLREKSGYTQRQVADTLGFGTPQQLSSIERGGNRMPPEHLAVLADMYRVPRAEITKNLMRYYLPYEYENLFGDQNDSSAFPVPDPKIVRMPGV
jgi:transcriptional regulator with XRE-family HTH domain